MNHGAAGTGEFTGSHSTPVEPVDGLLATVALAAPLVAEAAQADTAARWIAGGAAALAGLKLVLRFSRSEPAADPETLPLHMLDRSGQL